jgi:polar amino acid transport system substrate-binding protein
MKWLLLFLLSSTFTHATKLKWAADLESGAPYIFADPKNPSVYLGFEYELANAIAKELGMEAEFVQNSWEGLVPGLQRKQYDMIMNGVEITEDRKAVILFSRAYYVAYEQLVVRNDASSAGLDYSSLEKLKNKKIGTLKSSLAERLLRDVGGIEVLGYDAETNAYEDLKLGRSDGVLLDAPIAQYYAGSDRNLKFVGPPFGDMQYGIGVHRDNDQLVKKINAALGKIIASGELRDIYEKWKLWNPTMAHFFQDYSPARVEPIGYDYYMDNTRKSRSFKEQMQLYISFLPILAKGALTTLNLSLVAMALAVSVGLLLTILKLYAARPLSLLATWYIELVRGTPLLIQLFFIFYGLPHLGIKLSPFVAAILGLGMNYAAYEAENYRGGIQGIPRGQWEAAIALGLNKWQTLRHIVVPQALRIVLPSITNDFISLLKDSSLVSVITMVELTKLYGQLASTYYDFLGTGILVAIFYLLLGLPFVRLSRWLEKKGS